MGSSGDSWYSILLACFVLIEMGLRLRRSEFTLRIRSLELTGLSYPHSESEDDSTGLRFLMSKQYTWGTKLKRTFFRMIQDLLTSLAICQDANLLFAFLRIGSIGFGFGMAIGFEIGRSKVVAAGRMTFMEAFGVIGLKVMSGSSAFIFFEETILRLILRPPFQVGVVCLLILGLGEMPRTIFILGLKVSIRDNWSPASSYSKLASWFALTES